MIKKTENKIVKFMAIDPGINHLGLTIAEYDIINNVFTSTYCFTIDAKENKLNKDTIIKHSAKQAKIDYIIENLDTEIEINKPITVIAESPFYNHLRPAAFMPLVELLYHIRQIIRKYENINFITYSPSIIKKTVGASAICKKEEVKVYVRKHLDELKFMGEYEELDEHSIDSLAVMYTHIKLSVATEAVSKQ